MAISMIGTPTSLFTILGKCAAVVKNLGSYQSTQLTSLTNPVTGVVSGLDPEPDVQAITGGGYIGALTGTGAAVGGLMQRQCSAVINRQVFRDFPRLNQTLTQSNTLASLQEVIRQMKAGGFTIRACTVGGSISTFATPSLGNGTVNFSVRRPFDGRVLENTYQEIVKISCTADAYTGGAVAFREGFSVNGAGQQQDVFAFNWPLGSGASSGLTAIDGETSGGGNLLTNSGFDSFTDDTPDNWVVGLGTPGTDFGEDTGNTLRGTSSLYFQGDGATLPYLTQTFNSSSGTTSVLSAISQYSLCAWLRRDAVVPAAGVMRFSLVDQNGTILQDVAGVACSMSVDLTTLSTTYAPFTVAFRTPLAMPTTVAVKVELTTALTTGRKVYLDLMSMGSMTQMYTSGPYFAVHSGSDQFALNDLATVSITNSRGSGGTLDTWQTALARLFPDVLSNELLFPSSSSPNVLDSLIG